MNEMQKSSNKWLFVLTWSILSIVTTTSIYAYVWYIFFKDVIANPFYRRGNWFVIVLYVLLVYFFTTFLHGYNIGVNRVLELIYSHGVSIFLTNLFTYFQIVLMKLEFFVPYVLIIMSIVQFFIMGFFIFIGNKLFYNIFPPKNILVITSDGKTNDITLKMMLLHKKYKITEVVNYYDLTKDELREKIIKNKAVLLSESNKELQSLLLPICFEIGRNIYFYPSVENIMASATDKKTVIDTPLLLCKNSGFSGEILIVKRIIDIIGSIVLLVVSFPIVLIIALLIKLEDGGTIFFTQERLTRGGLKFKLYKFRSMVVAAEPDGIARLAKQNDDRITKIGKFIRRTRLDEIPQFINILKGDLTFVGPRPERPEIAKEYEKTLPEFNYRLKVKAGLTGYSQVVGKYNTTPQDKLLLDLYYIKNCSILFDFEILLMTAKVLLLADSTQGVQ